MAESLLKSTTLVWLTIAPICVFRTEVIAETPLSTESSLEVALETRLTEIGCPGALVGVFPDSGPSQVFALGVADRETKAEMNLDFKMRIGSTTKLFVGTIVLRLAGDGQLSLDDPISKYVENVPQGGKITLRMLGNNTSGLFNSIENKEFQMAIVAEPKKEWSAEEILSYAFAKPAYNEPGAKWRYSNSNAILLGMVIEKVTNKPLPAVIEEMICKPLGLADTGYLTTAELPEPHPTAYRNGYENKWIGYGKTPYTVTDYSSSWTHAAGNMYSTVNDLGKAARVLTMGELLKPAEREVLHDWIKTGYENIEYGFCIGKSDKSIGHVGDVPGFQSVLFYSPEQKTAIVVLTNLSNNPDGTMPAEELAAVITKHMNAHSATQ